LENNQAMLALKALSREKQQPYNVYKRRKYTTSEEAHLRLSDVANELGMTISEVVEALILSGIPEANEK